ncbi:MAG: hypothetical protein HY293_21230 [Planctomycetes bacterium]|nr:hypothetical protein [Planctomycetota bacterium]
MKSFPPVLLAALLASCSPDAPPPAAKKPVLPADELQGMPAPAAPKPPPPAEKPKPIPVLVQEDVHAERVALPLEPKVEEPLEARSHLPAFSFRTMNHATVEVFVNGGRFSSTACLWSVFDTMQFDPDIPVPDWPPPCAKLAGTTRRLVDNGRGLAEVYIAPGDQIQPRIPHLKEGEHVLYVKARIGACKLYGAQRLYVGKPGAPYRFTEYCPIMDGESEGSSRFARTLWFEPVNEE